MSRLHDLYTELITHQIPQHMGWYSAYRKLTDDVKAVQAALRSGARLVESASFVGTQFANEADPFRSFAERLILSRSNGISDVGLSFLARDTFESLINDGGFVAALEMLVKDASASNAVAFLEAWETVSDALGVNRAPLRVHRVVAACTTKVSSTVSHEHFERVYKWLIDEGLLPKPNPTCEGWYEKNVYLMGQLSEAFRTAPPQGAYDPCWLSIFVWALSQHSGNPFRMHKQVVRYGAPGTGKTFTARRDVQLAWEVWRSRHGFFSPDLAPEECFELVQFHPSYGYEDFVEGLRPALSTGAAVLQLQNGSFKEFCRRAGRWEIELAGIPEFGLELAKRWPELTVGELLPHVGSDLKDPTWQKLKECGRGERIAEIVPPFFFLIDEINRAELSRVLGELMFCLEYRGAGGAVKTQYAGLNTRTTAMLTLRGNDHKFFIPHNVHVIGTMNTIDRSVENFDLALRRRFRWERVNPDIEMLHHHLEQGDAKSGGTRKWAELAENLETLNEAIRDQPLLGRDYEIGHAYLMNLRYSPSLAVAAVRQEVWRDAILPLLEEYLRGSNKETEILPGFAEAFGLKS